MDSYLVVLRILPRRFFDSIVTKKLQKKHNTRSFARNNFKIFEVESKSIYIKKKKKNSESGWILGRWNNSKKNK